MIKHLKLSNFTVFKEADLKFSQGLNVIIGENGTGKSHLLKMTYLLSNAWSHLSKESSWSKDRIESYFSERVRQVFKPDKIGSLTTVDSDGKSSVGFWYCPPGKDNSLIDEKDWRFSFSNRSKEKISTDGYEFSDIPDYGKSIYLPSKEMVSFFEGFLAAYEKRESQFDETYRDLALHLSATKLKTPPAFIKQGLKSLSVDVGGTLKLEGGKFYLVSSGSKSREITLIAEGIRKIATLLYLLENGSLEVGDTLFWDEPESNLNPKLIKDVAVAIYFLCQNGIQVVIATHSYFLLKELDLLSRSEKNSPQITYFGLIKSDGEVIIEQGDKFQALSTLVALDEELAQYDREQALYYQTNRD